MNPPERIKSTGIILMSVIMIFGVSVSLLNRFGGTEGSNIAGAVHLVNDTPDEIEGGRPSVESELPPLSVTATVYHAVPNQTDNTPYQTADMSCINKQHPEAHRWIALSPDLFTSFKYGDTIKVTGTWIYDGLWIVHDRMNSRFTKSIDFLIKKGMYKDKWYNVTIEKT